MPPHIERTSSALVEYVRNAIGRGDKLPNSPCRKPARRRALIIAPTYAEPASKYPQLSSTAHDVKLVREMLIKWRYDPCNIRILCDVCGGFNGRADPTRENILSSLEWLVRGTQEGDYRFLHFSGHADRFLSDSTRGKEARLVPSLKSSQDYEIDEEHTVFPAQIRARIITVRDRVYYNEAIITRSREIRDEDMPGDASRIWDSELNAMLSKLPKSSTITTVMDCCASGRILNTNTKLLGGGLRARPGCVTSSGRVLVRTGGNPMREHDTRLGVAPSTKDRQLRHRPGEGASAHGVIHNDTAVCASTREFIPVRYNSSIATTIMVEKLPARERNMDHIKARVFAWAGCHQRQGAWDTSDFKAGLFTKCFTQCFLPVANNQMLATRSPTTYSDVFERVSDMVSKARAAEPDTNRRGLQFVQLWTSLRYNHHNHQNSILRLPARL